MLELVRRRVKRSLAIPMLDSLQIALRRFFQLSGQEPIPVHLTCEVDEEELLVDPQLISRRPDLESAQCSLLGDLPIVGEGTPPDTSGWVRLIHSQPFPSLPLTTALEFTLHLPVKTPLIASALLYALSHATPLLYPIANSPPWPCEIVFPEEEGKDPNAHLVIHKRGLLWRHLPIRCRTRHLALAIQVLLADALNLTLDSLKESAQKSEEELFFAVFPDLDQRMREAVSKARDNWEKANWSSLLEPRWMTLLEQAWKHEELLTFLREELESLTSALIRESELTVELFRSSVFPAVEKRREEWVRSLRLMRTEGISPRSEEMQEVETLTREMGEACKQIEALEALLNEIRSLSGEAQMRSCLTLLRPKRSDVSASFAPLAAWIKSADWPFPKLRIWK